MTVPHPPGLLTVFIRSGLAACTIVAACLYGTTSHAGWVEERDGKTIIHVKLYSLPDPTRVDTDSRAKCAVVNKFVEEFPRIFREKYRDEYAADPMTFGRFNWDNVEIELHRFSGISIEGQGMDSRPLMAIAGGVSPDIIYVNFRQSDTYIQQGFLYPLDKPEDNYLTGMEEKEIEFHIHPKIMPVIRRKGPRGETHVWAKPVGGVLGKVMLYRKDLLDAAGVPYPSNDWTWEDLYDACRKITDPEKGTLGIRFGRGKAESWHWVTFLWSAGGDAMVYDEAADQWRAVFDSRASATALDFYTRLCTEQWIDTNGKKRYGYAAKETEEGRKWDLGQIGFTASYIDEKLFATINPDVLGMAPVPFGYPDENGVRHRGAELNSRMQGIFAGVTNPVIRDAAWEYMLFTESEEAVRIRTRVMVEGGLGRFVNPRYLRMFGYEDLIRLAPCGWEECFRIAIETGKPEPYGRNCQLVYDVMTGPLQEAERQALEGKLPSMNERSLEVLGECLEQDGDPAGETAGITIERLLKEDVGDENRKRLKAIQKVVGAAGEMDREEAHGLWAELMEKGLPEVREKRMTAMQGLLAAGVAVANEKMIGVIPPKELMKRRAVAALLLAAIVVAFTLVFRKIAKAFTPPDIGGVRQVRWGFRKYWLAYLLVLPAVFSIFFWQYVPLVVGSKMAFQDYEIMRPSRWVGIDNFAGLLWDIEWWRSVWNSLRYSVLVISLTFLPPVVLAVFLQEIPRFNLFFRTVFYLPAVISGLVVIYLWKSFYEPTEFGVLNAVVLKIPAIGFILIGLLLFAVLYLFARRLYVHHVYWVSYVCFAAGVALFWFCFTFAQPILEREGVPLYRALFLTMDEPYRWLLDSRTAMLCCVLPMIWAGMGPGCLIYLAALKGVAPDFYEAADIDGATFVDKILFIVIPILRPLLVIQFVGIFIGAWKSSAFILAMTGGASKTTVAGLHIFYKAYMYQKFGPAAAMAWVLGFMLIGFTVHQLRILSKLEFKTTGNTE